MSDVRGALPSERQELVASDRRSSDARSPLLSNAIPSAEAFREAMASLATGVSILSTFGTQGRAGMTCSAVCPVTDTPPTILACVHSNSATNATIKAHGRFAVSCLPAARRGLAEAFAGMGRLPMEERFGLAEWGRFVSGQPFLVGSLMALDCQVKAIEEIGTHSVLFAEVASVQVHGIEAPPLVYQRRSFLTTRPI